MTIVGSGVPPRPEEYWERRALRYARAGAGLGAVCSYGMPFFYNQFIDLSQRLALRRWLKQAAGRDALDLGCGVGRWSLRMARRARSVVGVDLSPTMAAEARKRAESRGLSANCRFLVADASNLALRQEFGFILGVTVLQHILEDGRWRAAIQRIVEHLADDGLLVLLEAAPSRLETRCDTPVFRARTAGAYWDEFRRAGLACVAITGVDPAPFKTFLLPHYGELPRMVRLSALAAVTGASLALDLPAGRICVSRSWHKVFVLRKSEDRERSL